MTTRLAGIQTHHAAAVLAQVDPQNRDLHRTSSRPSGCPVSVSLQERGAGHPINFAALVAAAILEPAQVGQQGTLTRIWAAKGSRPPAPRDQRYRWAYLFGAVCPARGTGAGLVLPLANGPAMTLHLAEISRLVAPGAHAVVTLDGAGWHQTGGKLRVPDNVSLLLLLPPYSPELNPVENVWQFLRQNQLSNRVFDSYDAIVDACCTAWNVLIDHPARITSIATRDWAQITI